MLKTGWLTVENWRINSLKPEDQLLKTEGLNLKMDETGIPVDKIK